MTISVSTVNYTYDTLPPCNYNTYAYNNPYPTSLPTTKKELGRLDVIKRDLRQMDLTWEEAEELVNDKAEWRRHVAQCSHLDAG